MPKQKGKGARAKELVKGPVDLCKAPISGKGKIAKEKWPARQAENANPCEGIRKEAKSNQAIERGSSQREKAGTSRLTESPQS